MRIVFDTNVLIDSFSDPYSYSARLLDAVTKGTVTAVVSHAVVREYRKIVQRLVNDTNYQEHIESFIESAEHVKPTAADISIDDQDDKKFISAAIGGSGDLIVTSDRHLLDIGEAHAIPIVTPSEAWQRFNDQQGGQDEWQEWAQNLGIG